MHSFDEIFQIAADRKGGADALNAMLEPSLSADDFSKTRVLQAKRFLNLQENGKQISDQLQHEQGKPNRQSEIDHLLGTLRCRLESVVTTPSLLSFWPL